MSGQNLFNVASAREQHMSDSSIDDRPFLLSPNRTYRAKMMTKPISDIPLQVQKETLLNAGDTFSYDNITYTYKCFDNNAGIAIFTHGDVHIFLWMSDYILHNPSTHPTNITIHPNRTYKARLLHIQARRNIPLQVYAETTLRLGESFQARDGRTFTYVHWNDRSNIAKLTSLDPVLGTVNVYLYVNEYTT